MNNDDHRPLLELKIPISAKFKRFLNENSLAIGQRGNQLTDSGGGFASAFSWMDKINR